MVRAKVHVTKILHICCKDSRLRAVSYFSLQSYCTRNLSTRAARNEGVSPRRKNKRPSFLAWSQSLIVIITSWFAIALDEIRTRRILGEKADCKQSTVWNISSGKTGPPFQMFRCSRKFLNKGTQKAVFHLLLSSGKITSSSYYSYLSDTMSV